MVSDRLRYTENLAELPPATDLLRRAIEKPDLVKGLICHGLWLCAPHTEMIRGRKLTCHPNPHGDAIAYGADFVDEDVVEDGDLITARTGGHAHLLAKAILARIAPCPRRGRARPPRPAPALRVPTRPCCSALTALQGPLARRPRRARSSTPRFSSKARRRGTRSSRPSFEDHPGRWHPGGRRAIRHARRRRQRRSLVHVRQGRFGMLFEPTSDNGSTPRAPVLWASWGCPVRPVARLRGGAARALRRLFRLLTKTRRSRPGRNRVSLRAVQHAAVPGSPDNSMYYDQDGGTAGFFTLPPVALRGLGRPRGAG